MISHQKISIRFFNFETEIFQMLFTGVDRFVNFGHRPWWYGGHFCHKAGKNLEKKLFQ
jgi:hypothetical protein